MLFFFQARLRYELKLVLVVIIYGPIVASCRGHGEIYVRMIGDPDFKFVEHICSFPGHFKWDIIAIAVFGVIEGALREIQVYLLERRNVQKFQVRAQLRRKYYKGVITCNI